MNPGWATWPNLTVVRYRNAASTISYPVSYPESWLAYSIYPMSFYLGSVTWRNLIALRYHNATLPADYPLTTHS